MVTSEDFRDLRHRVSFDLYLLILFRLNHVIPILYSGHTIYLDPLNENIRINKCQTHSQKYDTFPQKRGEGKSNEYDYEEKDT